MLTQILRSLVEGIRHIWATIWYLWYTQWWSSVVPLFQKKLPHHPISTGGSGIHIPSPHGVFLFTFNFKRIYLKLLDISFLLCGYPCDSFSLSLYVRFPFCIFVCLIVNMFPICLIAYLSVCPFPYLFITSIASHIAR